jgi:hypothetical protein
MEEIAIDNYITLLRMYNQTALADYILLNKNIKSTSNDYPIVSVFNFSLTAVLGPGISTITNILTAAGILTRSNSIAAANANKSASMLFPSNVDLAHTTATNGNITFDAVGFNSVVSYVQRMIGQSHVQSRVKYFDQITLGDATTLDFSGILIIVQQN